MPRSSSSPPDQRPLTERLRPATLDEMVGNARAIEELRRWARAWTRPGPPPRQRAALLEGPPGVGKTTAALALAQEMGWTVVEMNASDARNQSAIEQVAGRAALAHTLGSTGTYRDAASGGRTLILLDEADCLTGRATETPAARPSVGTLREFLRSRYQSVEALAKAWGLGLPGAPAAFARWEQVPATGGRGAWTRLPAAQRDLAEWKGAAQTRDSSDRGGMGAISRLVRETRQPLVLAVNDERPLTRYSPVFRTGVARIRFSPARESEVRTLLRRIAVREGYTIGAPAMDAIVRRSAGDLRGALNDLEAIAPLPLGADQVSILSGRDLESNFFDLVGGVLEEPRFYRSVEIRDRLDSTPDDVLPWIEENLPRFARDDARRADAYAWLGRAELDLARARRFRVYALWSFATEIMTGGVSLALGPESRRGAAQVGFPQFLGEMGRTRGLRAMRASLLDKVGEHCHLSRRKGAEEFLPFLEGMFAPGRPSTGLGVAALRRRLARELKLTAEELAFLTGTEVESAQVRALLPPKDEESGADEPVEEKAERLPSAPDASPPAQPQKGPPTSPAEGKRKVQRQLGEF